MMCWIIMWPFKLINIIGSQVQKGRKEEIREVMCVGVLGVGAVRSLGAPIGSQQSFVAGAVTPGLSRCRRKTLEC